MKLEIIIACESVKTNDIVSYVYDSSTGKEFRSAYAACYDSRISALNTQTLQSRMGSLHIEDNTTDANKDNLISILELSQNLKEPTNNADYQYPVILNVGKLERVGVDIFQKLID